MNDSTGIWVLADVDDNLITTVRTAPGPDAVECSWDKEGRVCGFLTPKQEALFGLLQAGANVVPVTARSTVERVALPFNGYAILANGGSILGPGGAPVPAWSQRMESLSRADELLMRDFAKSAYGAAQALSMNVRVTVVESEGLAQFISIKHNDKNQDELATLAGAVRALVPDGWALHHNANAIMVMPPWLGKDKAVEWFIANVVPAGAVTIGMGDSLSDLPFMDLCDYVLMPRKAQNWKALLEALSRR
jgi:hydroxymethylpyrimidine pyrophosphatase-like HAD family hydrolase